MDAYLALDPYPEVHESLRALACHRLATAHACRLLTSSGKGVKLREDGKGF